MKNLTLSIPDDVYEAATIDGAGFWQRHRHVTLPTLTPVIFFNLVMGIIDAIHKRGKVIVIDPVRTATAARADE